MAKLKLVRGGPPRYTLVYGMRLFPAGDVSLLAAGRVGFARGDWARVHPRFKTRLFRFVDVFPACRDNDDVLRHLSEYLADVEVPRLLGLGLGLADVVPLGARVSAATARRNVLRMARQLIAGAT